MGVQGVGGRQKNIKNTKKLEKARMRGCLGGSGGFPGGSRHFGRKTRKTLPISKLLGKGGG